jgi:hypothetical protein
MPGLLTDLLRDDGLRVTTRTWDVCAWMEVPAAQSDLVMVQIALVPARPESWDLLLTLHPSVLHRVIPVLVVSTDQQALEQAHPLPSTRRSATP